LAQAAARARRQGERSRLGLHLALPGPAGESNLYSLHPHGTVLCLAETEDGLLTQIGAALATGNRALVRAPAVLGGLLEELPAALRAHVVSDGAADVVLFEGGAEALRAAALDLAVAEDGPIRPIFTAAPDYPLEFLLAERSTSTNTAAAGGNASLMTIG
jgi:RHH-type proline utilization regulon transcriptional repressor/proline dehydrogenase/delta 1-pyrroline-5-carboxylate dehydrogenase